MQAEDRGLAPRRHLLRPAKNRVKSQDESFCEIAASIVTAVANVVMLI